MVLSKQVALKVRREASIKGVSLRKLADQAEIPLSTLHSRLSNRTSFQTHEVVQLSRVLQVDLRDMLLMRVERLRDAS